MNWKLTVAIGAAVGGVWWAAQRRTGRPPTPDGWAGTTDPVPRA